MSSATLARHSPARELLDLFASMRFAIALLTVICISSVIGTVVNQGEAMGSYIDKFGPFWAALFGRLGLFTVYSAPWFLAILAFLVVSTSLQRLLPHAFLVAAQVGQDLGRVAGDARMAL